MKTASLALMCIEGVGPRMYKNLLAAFGTASAVFQQDKKTLLNAPGVTRGIANSIAGKTYEEELDHQLEWMEKNAANYVSLPDAAYPEILRHIYDAPPVLMYMGAFEKEDDIAFAVVGMRYPDDYGKQMCYKIAKGIAEKGICIVSGMAKGIDAISHQAALDTGARTIAVLGTSLDTVYPAENRHLFNKIKEKGVVCSETLIGQKQVPANFIRRNRIISGLSRGVVVAQAGTKSGSLVTALSANEQNRDVFAVPGNALKGRHTGCHRLIRLGAKIVENADDVLNEYPFLKERLSAQTNWILDASAKQDMNEQERSIIALLDKEGVHIDILLKNSNVARSELMTALLNLEIKGYITVKPGNYYIRNI